MSSKTNDECRQEDEQGTCLSCEPRSAAGLSGKLAMYLSTSIGLTPGKVK